MPPALAPLATNTLPDEEARAFQAQREGALAQLGAGRTFAEATPTRGIPGQVLAGIQRGAFGVGATFGDALGVLFPDTGKGIRDYFQSFQMQSSGAMLEQAAETATQSLGVLASSAMALTAGGVPAATGIGLGALTALATPAVFGMAQATQTREFLQAANDAIVKQGGQPLTGAEIGTAMAATGATEFGTEYISNLFFLKRFFPGSTAMMTATDQVRKYFSDQALHRSIRMVARATEESVRAGAREAPEEFAAGAIESAVLRGALGPERRAMAERAGLQVPGAPMEEGAQAAKIALLAGPFFAAGGAAGSRMLRGRQATQTTPGGQQASDIQAATTPAPTPPTAPVVASSPAQQPRPPGIPGAPRRTDVTTTTGVNPLTGEGTAIAPLAPAPAGAGVVVYPLTGETATFEPEAMREPPPQASAPPTPQPPPEGLPSSQVAPAAVPLSPDQQALYTDLVGALRGLGYPARDIPTMAQAAMAQQPASIEDAIRLAVGGRPATEAMAPRAQPQGAAPGVPAEIISMQAIEQDAFSLTQSYGVMNGLALRALQRKYPVVDIAVLETAINNAPLHSTSQQAQPPGVVPVQAESAAIPEPSPQQEPVAIGMPVDVLLPEGRTLPGTVRNISQDGSTVAVEREDGRGLSTFPIEQVRPRAQLEGAAPAQEANAAAPVASPQSAAARAINALLPAERAPTEAEFQQLHATIAATEAVAQRLNADYETMVNANPNDPRLSALIRQMDAARANVEDVHAAEREAIQRLQAESPASMAPPRPTTLEELSQEVEQQGAATQARLERERVEAETRTRLRPTVPQAPPTGMFEQEQELPLGERPVTPEEQQEALLHQEDRGPDILDVIRGEDRQGRRGMAVTGSAIARELTDIAGIRNGGRGDVTGLINNASGTPLPDLLNDLKDQGFLLAEMGEDDLKTLLEARLRTGKPYYAQYAPGGLFEPAVALPTPGGDRADATPETRRQAATIPTRLQHIAAGESIISIAYQPQPGKRITIPGVRRREGAIEIARAIPPNPVIEGLRTTGSVAFVGQTIRTGREGSYDTAVLGALVRDPQEEHLHWMLGDAQGNVLRVVEVGSRLPGSAAPFVKEAGAPVTPGAMARWLKDLTQLMRETGASTLRALHNHPSGNPTPSEADRRFTQRIAAAIPGFQGHTVIDSGRYAHITPDGQVSIEDLPTEGPDPFLQPSLGVSLTQIPIRTTADAANVGRALAKPTFVTVMLLNKHPSEESNRVRGVLLVPEAAFLQGFDHVEAYLREVKREFGAVLATTYYNGINPAVGVSAEMLFRSGALRDHVGVLPQGVEISFAEAMPEAAIPPRLAQRMELIRAAGEQVEEPPLGQVAGFEQSKVLNDEGMLKPVFHGTAQMFAQFDPAKKGSGAGQMFDGFFFAENPQVASRYAERQENQPKRRQQDVEYKAATEQGPNVRPVYLNITRPFDMTQDINESAIAQLRAAIDQRFGDGTGDYAMERLERAMVTQNVLGLDAYRAFARYGQRENGDDLGQAGVTQALQDLGYDGLYHEGERDGKVWVVFSPEQIVPVFSQLATFPPGLRGAEGIAEEAPTLPTPPREPAVLTVPTTIEGVTVAQANKAFLAYQVGAVLGNISQPTQQALHPATFRKLKITVPQMAEMSQNAMLRWLTVPGEFSRLLTDIRTNPDVIPAPHVQVALAKWNEAMLHHADASLSAGDMTQEDHQDAVDRVVKFDLSIPTASQYGRGLRMQRSLREMGTVRLADYLTRLEKAKGAALTSEENQQATDRYLAALRSGDINAIFDIMEKTEDPALLDYYWELYYGSLLSGLPTLNVNTFGTLAHITFQKFVVGPTAVGLDWMISGFSGQERQRYMREVFADFNATWKNAGQQYKDAWYWWKSPFPRAIGGAGQLATPPGALAQGLAMTRSRQFDLTGAEAFARAPLQSPDGTPNRWGPVMRRLAPFVGAASRVMMATDAVATNLAFQGEVAKLATREGIQRLGLQNREQVDNFVEHVTTHLMQYPAIEAAAKAAAQSDTFNDPAGALARAILSVRRVPQPFGAFFRLLTPFANTPDRLLARGAELVPGLGLVVGYREAGYTDATGFAGNFRGWLADFSKGEPKAVEVAAKQIVGLMLASMAAMLWDRDLLTGPLPTEPQERQAWERQGKLPFAIRIGNSWVEYRRLEPFLSIPFGALTSGLAAIQTMRENRLKQGLKLDYASMEDASAVAAGIAFNFTRFFLDSSYFSGLANFFESTSRTSQGFATGLTQQLVSATLPLSGLLRNMHKTLEASGWLGTEPGVVLMRQRESVGEQYLRSIPGAAAGVRVRYDVHGQPVVSERPILGPVGALLSPIRRTVATEDPVEAVYDRLQYRPGRPLRRQLETVVGRRIEDEEYDAYAQRRGDLAHETIERLVVLPFFEQLPQDKQLARLKQAFRQATRRAGREVFGRGETIQERRARFREAQEAGD